jgi:hypothetical protein
MLAGGKGNRVGDAAELRDYQQTAILSNRVFG